MARTALAACDGDLTIDQALRDCRRLVRSWYPEITRLVPHLLVAPTGELSGRQIAAILSAEDRR